MKLFGGGGKRRAGEPEDNGPAPLADQTDARPLRRDVSVVIVDDDDEVRFVLRVALESAGFQVVADAGNAETAVAEIAQHKPDMVLLDLHMPDIGGLEILPLIYEDVPTTKVVVISAISATYMTEAALQEGAWGYIVKGVSAKTIADHLVQVAESGAVRPVRPYPLMVDVGATRAQV